MKGLKLFLLLGVFVFSLAFASAGATCLTVDSKTTPDYFEEIPLLDAQLSSCKVDIPDSAFSVVGAGNILVTVNMNDGSIKQAYFVISSEKALSGIRNGAPADYNFEVIAGEATIDKILASDDAANEILRGVNEGGIKIKAKGFIRSLKWFFAKFFLPNPIPVGSGAGGEGGESGSGSGQGSGGIGEGKPDFCEDTYLLGHKEYAANKEKWDAYSSDTDKVCQSQYGKGIPSPCIYAVQLSIEGKPYYLCWYNE